MPKGTSLKAGGAGKGLSTNSDPRSTFLCISGHKWDPPARGIESGAFRRESNQIEWFGLAPQALTRLIWSVRKDIESEETLGGLSCGRSQGS